MSSRTLLARTLRLAGAMAVAVSATVGSTAAAQEKLSVKFDFLPYGSHGPFWLAKEKGWFKEAGVDPEFQDGQGSTVAVQLLAAGKIDVAYVSLGSLIIARSKGVPVKAIGGILRKNDYGVLVDASSSISTPKDLEGKVLYYSPSSVETLYMDLFFAKNGVDKSKVNLTSIDLSTKVSTYMSGKGDAMFVPIPIYTINAVPRKSKGILFAEYGIPMPGFGLISNEDVIKDKPKALAAFVGVMQKAWGAVATDPKMLQAAVDAVMAARPQAKLNRDIVDQQLQSVIPFLYTDGTQGKPLLWQSPTEWQGAIAVNEEAGAIEKGSDPADYYTNEFVPQ